MALIAGIARSLEAWRTYLQEYIREKTSITASKAGLSLEYADVLESPSIKIVISVVLVVPTGTYATPTNAA